jgi:hypothetical protein
MHILMLHVEGLPNPLGLRYQNADKALATLEGLRNAQAGTTVDLVDDYGQHVSVPRARLIVPQVFDLARDLDAKSDIAVIEARAQQRLQTTVRNDPVLGLALAGQQIMPGSSKMLRPQ